MERIGECCFDYSDIEELTLPATLQEVGEDALRWTDLRVVRVEEGCVVNVKRHVQDSAIVLSVKIPGARF